MNCVKRLATIAAWFAAVLTGGCAGTSGIEANKFAPLYQAGTQVARAWMNAESPGTMADLRAISTSMEPSINRFANAVERAKTSMSAGEMIILGVFEVALALYQYGHEIVAAEAAGDFDQVVRLRAMAADVLQEMYPAQATEVRGVSDTKALVELLWQLGGTIVGAAHYTIEQQTGVRL